MRDWAVAGIALALFVLLAIAAIGAGRVPSSSGDAQLPMDGHTIQWVIVDTTWILVVIAAIWLMLPHKGAKKRRPQVKRTSWITAVVVLTVMFFVFLELGKITRQVEPAIEGTVVSLPDAVAPHSTSLPPASTVPAGPPNVLLFVVGGVLLVAAVVAATRKPLEETLDVASPEVLTVAGVLDDLLAELERSPDPRQVVIGAYARMEQALARDGTPRRRSEAPLEYLQRALERLQVSSRSVARLTDLFAEARFSPHEIDETMSSEAKAALRDVRGELGASA